MGYTIFVDGQEGTTGLRINQCLSGRDELELLHIDPEKRKDPKTRRTLLNEADLVFLCLPDSASVESVSLIDNNRTKVIDASTAHRTCDGWTYGLPELKGSREKIRQSKRTAVPGCHATASITALYPLIESGVIPRDYPISLTSITGYSGGGKSLIAKYEASSDTSLSSPKHYALKLTHKHLPEMQRVLGLVYPPHFTPVVGKFYQGLAVSIPVITRLLDKRINAGFVRDILAEYYDSEPFIRVMEYDSEDCTDGGYFNVEGCNGTNRNDICVFGNDDNILIISRLDNLGKGASGAAVQCMNLMLGLDEETGLRK